MRQKIPENIKFTQRGSLRKRRYPLPLLQQSCDGSRKEKESFKLKTLPTPLGWDWDQSSLGPSSIYLPNIGRGQRFQIFIKLVVTTCRYIRQNEITAMVRLRVLMAILIAPHSCTQNNLLAVTGLTVLSLFLSQTPLHKKCQA